MKPLSSAPAARRRKAGAVLAVGIVAASIMTAVPAQALTGYLGTQTALDVASDLAVESVRYVFKESGSTSLSGSTQTETNGTTSIRGLGGWGMAVPGVTTDTVMTGRVTDYDRVSDFWVRVAVSTTSTTHYTATCDVFRGDPDAGGVLLDPDEESPYQCESASSEKIVGTAPDVLFRETFALTSRNWTAARAGIAPVGVVSLGEGKVESTATRLIVDDHWYPTDPAAQKPYQSVAADSTRELATYARNGEGTTRPPTLYFAYRIYDEGTPTDYWVGGHVGTEKSGLVYYHSNECAIYDGDPVDDDVTEKTPYSCEMDYTNPVGKSDWRVAFVVTRAAMTDLIDMEAGKYLRDGCANADSICTYVLRDHRVKTGPLSQLSNRAWNETGSEFRAGLEVEVVRATTSSFETTISTTAEFFGLFKASVKQSFGYEITDKVTKSKTLDWTIAPYSVGWLSEAPATDHYTGDFMFYLDKTWYRAKNATYKVPSAVGDLIYQCASIKGLSHESEECELPAIPRDQQASDDTVKRATALAVGEAPTPTAPPTATGPNGAVALAETGGELQPLPVLVGGSLLIALGAGAILLVLIRRRRHGIG